MLASDDPGKDDPRIAALIKDLESKTPEKQVAAADRLGRRCSWRHSNAVNLKYNTLMSCMLYSDDES
ncbi:MAG: hypothetical protein A2X48_05745 [Lentisphaerae bacterium GWF2_49_21]|nr:MAG: hypothetical protein A2X48_05745 [Lentisphaerae bacterium GWF2_49_21]